MTGLSKRYYANQNRGRKQREKLFWGRFARFYRMSDGFLRVENFEKMQHKDIFKKSDGKPPWIKFFVKLLDNEDFEDLDYVAQLAYVKLLLLAARKENSIPNRPSYVAARLGMSPEEVTKAVTTLVEHGFLSQSKTRRKLRISSERVANDSLPPVHQEEKRIEEKPPSPPSGKSKACPECGLDAKALPQNTTLADHRFRAHGVEAIDGRAA